MRNALNWLLSQAFALLAAAQDAPPPPRLTPKQIAAYLQVEHSLGEDVAGDGVYNLISYN